MLSSDALHSICTECVTNINILYCVICLILYSRSKEFMNE